MISPARRAAYEVVRRVFEDGAWADRALPAALRRAEVPERERALAQRLAFGAVQRRGTSDHLAARFARRRPEKIDPPLLAALRLGTYELLFSDTARHAAVDQAVELAKRAPGGRRGAGLVNAVLRRVANEGQDVLDALTDDDPEQAAARHSYPAWMIELWAGELGGAIAIALAEAQNRPAETALRANELRTTREELIGELREGGVDAAPGGGAAPLDARESVVVGGPLGAPGASAIDAGRAVGQSRASMAAVSVLDPQPGERILDLCAGPGLKTTQMAARMRNEGAIRSVELRPQRAEQIEAMAAKLGATIVTAEAADAAHGGDLGEGYDRVLVDPPCSDLGTLASRPDARWRKEPGDPARLADLQRAILGRGAAALREGGTLVYSTCTLSARENEGVVRAIADRTGDIRPDDLGSHHPELAFPSDPRFLQIRPDRDGTTGFFIARLRRG